MTLVVISALANCFQIRSQRPWDRSHVPREGELGFENQVKNLSD